MQILHQQGNKSWLKSYYMAIVPMGWYDTVILSRFKCRFYKKPFEGSGMSRSMLFAELFTQDGDNIVVGSMHYESLNNTEERIKQMKQVYSITDKGRTVIIAGDYNFTDKMKENKHIPQKFKDLWLICHDSLEKSETMPENPKFPAWRPDHILCKSASSLDGADIKKVGQFSIEPYENQDVKDIKKDGIVRSPSDHFGLYGLIPL